MFELANEQEFDELQNCSLTEPAQAAASLTTRLEEVVLKGEPIAVFGSVADHTVETPAVPSTWTRVQRRGSSARRASEAAGSTERRVRWADEDNTVEPGPAPAFSVSTLPNSGLQDEPLPRSVYRRNVQGNKHAPYT